MSNNKTSSVGVRLTHDQRATLERIALDTGVEVSQLIRFSVDAIIEHYKRNGNRLVLPIDFDEIVTMEARRMSETPRKKSA